MMSTLANLHKRSGVFDFLAGVPDTDGVQASAEHTAPAPPLAPPPPQLPRSINARIRATDWNSHPLGSPEQWPDLLKTTLRILLSSRTPMWLAWNLPSVPPALFCNDACLPFLGPGGDLPPGSPANVVWADAWSVIASRLDAVRATGHARRDALHLAHPENACPTFSFTPLADDTGAIAGVLCILSCDHAPLPPTPLPPPLPVTAQAHESDATSLLQGSLDALTAHIAILDQDGVIIKVNEAWRRFAQDNHCHSPAYAVGMNYLHACAPHALLVSAPGDDATRALQGLRDVLDERLSSFVMEYPCHSPTQRRWFTMRVTRFGHGHSRRIVVAHEDVTERHEAEAAIREKTHRLRLATEAARLGTWDFDVLANRHDWDDRCKQLFGLLPDARVDYNLFLERLHPDDRDRVNAAINSALDPRSSTPYDVEYRTIDPASSHERWIRATGRTLWEDGVAARLTGIVQDVTERRRTTEALRRSEEMIRLATDAAGVGTWVCDIATDVVRCSPRLEQLIGVPPGGFRGGRQDVLAIVLPEDRERLIGVIQDAVTARREYEVEFRFRHSSGEHRWMVGRGRAWYDDAGRPVMLAGTAEDITARKEADAALARSEEQFRTLADSIPQLAWMARPDGHITWYNKRWYEYTGTTFEQMDRIGWRAVQDPSDVDRVAEKFHAAINDGQTWDDTFLLRRHDSEMRWHLAQALPLRDDRGDIVRWFGTHTDITAQRDAEESLRLSEERFRIMADSAPTLIWLAGADKLRSWFNKPWLEFTGRSMEQERGAGWLEGVHPEDMERCLQAYSDAFENRSRFQLEYRLRRHDGQYRWMLAHGLPLHSAGGRFAGLIGSCVDITDQVLARQTLERQQALLEEAVRARTAELQASNERLRLAERMASLGTLSAGLGHDMGNLLVPLRVRLESLSRAGLPEELREDVEAIRSSAEYLQRLASGLRMLAIDPRRVARGESAELTAWWAEVEPLLKNALPRNIELHAHMPSAECRVAISRAALTQAVFNLVQNAGDALRARGHGAVTISAHPRDNHVLVTVADNGPGMSDEVKARCMEPFFTTKTRGISTGLGLALVYGLIQEAGGSVEIKTTDGGGATFLLALPHAPALSQRPGHGKIALVALSDPRVRALVTSELRAMEFSLRPHDADTATVDVIVTENPSLIPPKVSPGRLVMLLTDKHPHPADGVVVLGSKPRLQAIRDVLRRIANEDRR